MRRTMFSIIFALLIMVVAATPTFAQDNGNDAPPGDVEISNNNRVFVSRNDFANSVTRVTPNGDVRSNITWPEDSLSIFAGCSVQIHFDNNGGFEQRWKRC